MNNDSEAGLNEMRMCADCLGQGRVDNHICVYCKGAGRVLTYRAMILRRAQEERMSEVAPALHEALRNIAERGGRRECERYSTGIGSCFVNGRRADALLAAEKCCAPCIANAALGLVKPTAEPVKKEQS